MSQAEILDEQSFDDMANIFKSDWPKRVRASKKQLSKFMTSVLVSHGAETVDNDHKHGKMLKLLNYDRLFEDSEGAKIINTDVMLSANVANEINSAIFSNSDGDLGFTATCKCGRFVGNYYQGAKCPYCDSIVSTAFADKLAHTCWVGIPDEMPPVIHPIVYLVLAKWSTFKLHGTPLIDVLINPELEMPDDLKEVFPKQGLSYFSKNFDYIMDYLLNKYPKTATKSGTNMVRMFLNTYRNDVFCRKLPILHNSLHIAAKSGVIRLVDSSVKDALKTVLSITYTAFTYKRSITHDKFIDVSLYKAFKGYIDYISSIGQHKLGDKHALFRHHILGCRCHWSQRAVIIPMVDLVMADELYIPWKIGVKTLKLELLNIMVNQYGIKPDVAIYRHDRAMSTYDPLIDEIMKGLIASHEFGGLPMIMGRNPI